MKFSAQASSFALVATTAVGSVAAAATTNQYQPYTDVIEIDQGLINGELHLLARDSLTNPLLITDDTDGDETNDVEDPMNSAAAATSAPVAPSANKKLHARFFGKRNNQLATIGALRRSQAAEAKKAGSAPKPSAPAAKAPITPPASTSTADEADDEGDDEDVNAADADMIEAMRRRAAVPRNLIDVNTGNGNQGSNPYLVNAWVGGQSAGSNSKSASSSSHKSSTSNGNSHKSSSSSSSSYKKSSSKKNNGSSSSSHKSSSSSKKVSNQQQQQETDSNGNLVQVNALNGGGNLLDLSLRKRLLNLSLGGTNGGSSNGAAGGAANGNDVTVSANGEDCDADDESDAYLVTAQFQRRRYDDSSNGNSKDNSTSNDDSHSKHGKGSKKGPTLAEIQAQETKLQGEIAQLGNATTTADAMPSDSAAMTKRQLSPSDQLNQLLQGMSPSTLAQVQSIAGSNGQSGLTPAQQAALQALTANVGGTTGSLTQSLPTGTLSSATNDPNLAGLQSSLTGLSPEQQISALSSALSALQANQYLAALGGAGLSTQQLQSLLPQSTLPTAQLQGLLSTGTSQLGGVQSTLSGLLAGNSATSQTAGAQSTLNGLLGNFPVSASSLSGLLGGMQPQLAGLAGGNTQALQGLASTLGLQGLTNALPLQLQQQLQQQVQQSAQLPTTLSTSQLNSLLASVNSQANAAQPVDSDSIANLQAQLDQAAKQLNVQPAALLSTLTSGDSSKLLSSNGVNTLMSQLQTLSANPDQAAQTLSGLLSGASSTAGLSGVQSTVAGLTNNLPLGSLSGLTQGLPLGSVSGLTQGLPLNSVTGLTGALPNVGSGLLSGLLGTHLPLNLQQQTHNKTSHEGSVAEAAQLATSNSPIVSTNDTSVDQLAHGASSVVVAATNMPTPTASGVPAIPTYWNLTTNSTSAKGVSAQSLIANVKPYTETSQSMPTSASSWSSAAMPTTSASSTWTWSSSEISTSAKSMPSASSTMSGATESQEVAGDAAVHDDTAVMDPSPSEDPHLLTLPPGTMPYPASAIIYSSQATATATPSAKARRWNGRKWAGRGLAFSH